MRGPASLRIVGVAIGLGAGLFAAWLCHPATRAGLLAQSLYRAELSLYDYRLAWTPSPGRSPDITIVTIDEESLAQPELNLWPWPRRFHAQVVRNLAQAGARHRGLILAARRVTQRPPTRTLLRTPLSADDESWLQRCAAGNVALAMEGHTRQASPEAAVS